VEDLPRRRLSLRTMLQPMSGTAAGVLRSSEKHIEDSTVSPRMRTAPDPQRPMMVANDIPHQRQAHTVTNDCSLGCTGSVV
jgi:hypothetical protein